MTRLLRALRSWLRPQPPVTGKHVPSEATKRGGYTIADIAELRSSWRPHTSKPFCVDRSCPGTPCPCEVALLADKGTGAIDDGQPQTVTLSGREYERYLEGALNDPPPPADSSGGSYHLVDSKMPSPKMLRDAANFVSNAVRHQRTAAWLRYVAGQVEDLDREEAAAGLGEEHCQSIGPAGYVCDEPLPHKTAHVAHLDEMRAEGEIEVDRWIDEDLPWLAELRHLGRCAAINAGRRYICSMPADHEGAHRALADGDGSDLDLPQVVDTWIG